MFRVSILLVLEIGLDADLVKEPGDAGGGFQSFLCWKLA